LYLHFLAGWLYISIAEEKSNVSKYRLEYFSNSEWKPIFNGENNKKVKINRFDRVWGSKVRIWIDKSDHQASISSLGFMMNGGEDSPKVGKVRKSERKKDIGKTCNNIHKYIFRTFGLSGLSDFNQ
jgi:hypothetical protein